MRMIVSLFVLSTLTSVACQDEGPARRQQAIFGIKVTPNAAVTDTIRISFRTGASPCDTDVKVEAGFPADGLQFTASSVPARGMCPVDAIQNPFIYIVSPPHLSPYTVRFAEPGESDSVRVVAS
ncbi:MAG: hypothetical protein ACRENK_01475 [Gemmatimonadaceae bacterium]